MHATTKTRMGIPTEKLGKDYKQIILRKKVGQSLSCIWLFAAPWTVACQAPLSMGFYRQEYWSGLPFLSLRDLPHQGSKQCLLNAGGFFTTEPPVKAHFSVTLPNCTLNRHHSSIPLKDFLKFVIMPSTIYLINPILLGMSVTFFN